MKKELVRTVLSLSAAKVAWQEVGRDFELGDKCCGKVGFVSFVGRIVVKVTAATITYVITDATLESLIVSANRIMDSVKGNVEEDNDDSITETEGGDKDNGEQPEDC